MADIYKAIADPTRRVILDELCREDGQSLFDICTRLTMRHRISVSRQAISQHLEILEDAGLLTIRWEGRCKLHYVNTRPLRELLNRWPISR